MVNYVLIYKDGNIDKKELAEYKENEFRLPAKPVLFASNNPPESYDLPKTFTSQKISDDEGNQYAIAYETGASSVPMEEIIEYINRERIPCL